MYNSCNYFVFPSVKVNWSFLRRRLYCLWWILKLQMLVTNSIIAAEDSERFMQEYDSPLAHFNKQVQQEFKEFGAKHPQYCPTPLNIPFYNAESTKTISDGGKAVSTVSGNYDS